MSNEEEVALIAMARRQTLRDWADRVERGEVLEPAFRRSAAAALRAQAEVKPKAPRGKKRTVNYDDIALLFYSYRVRPEPLTVNAAKQRLAGLFQVDEGTIANAVKSCGAKARSFYRSMGFTIPGRLSRSRNSSK